MRGGFKAVAFAISMGLFLFTLPAAAEIEIGNVTYPEYRGAVGFRITGDREDLKPQERVYQDERVTTGTTAVTSMVFADQTTLDVGSNSDIVLSELIYNPNDNSGKGVLSLTTGAFRVVSGLMQEGSLTILTPTATIGLRGTELVVFVLKDGTTEINLLHGALDTRICTTDTVVPMQAGQQLLITSECSFVLGIARALPPGIPELPSDLAALENLGDISPAAGGAGSAGPPAGPGSGGRGSPN
jgi:hypothetical protein